MDLSRSGVPRSTHEGVPGVYSVISGMAATLFLRREQSEAELGQLRVRHRRRRAGERVGTRLRLRERDHLADVLLAGEDRHQPVEPEREAGVRRRAVPEGVEQESEA